MAKTTVLTGNNLTQKLWEEDLFRDTEKESYFMPRFAGGSDKIIHVNTKLEKKQGDTVTFGIRMRLSGNGVTSNQTLEGNEEKLTTHDFSVSLEEYAHAVRDAGPLDRQRPIYDMDAESRDALKVWGAEKIDSLIFTALAASPTKTFYGGSATTDNTLTANDKLTPAIISKVRAWAKTGGATTSGRAQTPIRPVRVDGREYFVLLVHPYVMYDLKRDSEFAQALREAEVRGPSNPLFHGAAAIWDNVVVHEHENITWTTNSGAVNFSKCLFMGAQAGVWAWGTRPKTVAAEFDYGREHGFSYQMIAKAGKPVFNSKDYAVVGVNVANTNIT